MATTAPVLTFRTVHSIHINNISTENRYILVSLHIPLTNILRMDDILRGPKSHDLMHHLVEDIVRRGSPSGFDVRNPF